MKIGRGLSGKSGASSLTKLSFPTQLTFIQIQGACVLKVQVFGFGIGISWGETT